MGSGRYPRESTAPSRPPRRRKSSMYPMKGRLRSGTRALGMSYVIGRSRVPWPPTRTTAFISASQGQRLAEPGAARYGGDRDDKQEEQGRQQRQQVDGGLQRAAAGRLDRIEGGLLEEHVAYDPEVVGHREHAVHDQRPDDHEDEHRPGLDPGEDHPRLPPEPGEGRYTDQRRHKDAHARRERRARAEEAVKALPVLPDEVDDEERPDVHDRVGGRVDQDSLDRALAPLPTPQRGERRQDVPRVGHRAVC